MLTSTIPTTPVTLASGASARSAWPLDPAVVHLNHGSFGAVPKEVVAYQDELRREADRSPVAWFPRIAERVRAAREEVSPFVGARAQDTVFVPNASAAASVVYNSVRLRPGDEILVTDHGYGAVSMGARRLARRWKATSRVVDIPLTADDDTVVEIFRNAVTERTRLLVIDQITSSTARHLPTARIAEAAAAVGARTLVDGAHAPGLVPDAARVAGGDWWFGNLHKWPAAPRGAALLVTQASDRDELWPLIDSWGADESYPARFDTQGTIDATPYIAAPRSVSFIEREYGWDRTRHALQQMVEMGADIIGEAMQPRLDRPARPDIPSPAASMRLIRLPDGVGVTREDADALRMRMLDSTGVETAFTSFRGEGYFRLSAHLYNTVDDFTAFTERCIPLITQLAESRRGATGVIPRETR